VRAQAIVAAVIVLGDKSGLGHGVMLRVPCPRSIFASFVADPSAPVDSSCLDDLDRPLWSVG
jgi:hypothetical protein